jgi:phosphoribosylformylglycinamidine synthase I
LVKIGITVFPGSNCERDVYYVLKSRFGVDVQYIWYKEKLKDFDAIIIPGGFTYGDRLRAGVIAAHSSLMDKIKEISDNAVPILGICNGFQILVESGLLPGALVINKNLRFICKWTNIIVKNNKTPFTNLFKEDEKILIPIAHGEGKYVADKKTYTDINRKSMITLKYHGENPNGSFGGIAAVCNSKGNIMGMMPHPERACLSHLTPLNIGSNAEIFFKSLITYVK